MKRFVRTRHALAAAALAVVQCIASAQGAWPARPIRIIVPFPAGGQTDVAARVIGQAMSESLKVPVIVDNKAGAHGFIGAAEAAKAPPDGYTLMVGSTGLMAINPVLHQRMPYDPNHDFAPVSLLMTVPIVIMASNDAPFKTVQELRVHAKAHPGRVNYASAGNGGSSHLVAEYFGWRTGVSMTHIPYKGESPATADVAAGQVDLMFNTLVSTLPQLAAGRVRMLATTTRTRLAGYPDVPTVEEALGLKDFESSSWAALYVPAGTPAALVARLSSEADAALKSPQVARRLKELGALPVGGSGDRLGTYQRAEQEKWAKVVKAADVKVESR